MDSNANAVQDVVVDLLTERIRMAFAKIDKGQAQAGAGRGLWIEGTLELATVVVEKRTDFPDHQAFGRWLQQYRQEPITNGDRAALLGFGRDLVAARKLLEQSTSFKWRTIWENVPKRTPSGIGRGALYRRTGSNFRKRAAVIPTVMREDYVPGSVPRSSNLSRRRRRGGGSVEPPRERPLPILKGLTREQVDPDFVGTPQEFVAKYGLVNLQTKQEIEYHKRQEGLMTWLALVTDHAQSAHALLAVTVDPVALREWMTKPMKAAKLQGWRNAIAAAHEMLLDLQEKEVEQ